MPFYVVLSSFPFTMRAILVDFPVNDCIFTRLLRPDHVICPTGTMRHNNPDNLLLYRLCHRPVLFHSYPLTPVEFIHNGPACIAIKFPPFADKGFPAGRVLAFQFPWLIARVCGFHMTPTMRTITEMQATIISRTAISFNA
jgi:hypothetical protein